MAENNNDSNNKKDLSRRAWSFLKAFRNSPSLQSGRTDQALINIVAIDPNSLNVSGITRPVGDESVFKFIERNNGKRNLYFMVNTPADGAPDDKLKKEQVAFINAVWIDADPEKNKSFEDERVRLMLFADRLATSDHPPTYIVDSGGGFQAFWVLEDPVPAHEDTVKLFEGYSRGLADQHGTDRVHNIDRIMRIPCTWNIPTKKKLEQGRTMTLSTIKHAVSKTGVRYG